MKWFSNFSTMTKLMGSFGFLTAMMMVVGSVGVFNIGKLNGDIGTLYQRHMKGVTAILQAENARLDVGRAVRQAILEQDAAGARKQQEKALASLQVMAQKLDEAEKTLVSAEAKAQMKATRAILPEWQATNLRVIDLAIAGHVADAIRTLKDNSSRANQLTEATAALVKSKIDIGEKADAAAEKSANSARTLMLALVVLGALTSMGMGVVISRLISRPLQQAEQVLAVVAQGDFTQQLHVDTHDEVGRMAASLNAAVTAMRTALQQVSNAAHTVSTASAELSSASGSISSGAQEQASSLEETAASLEEMTAAVKQNADNAQQAAQLAQGAREVAEKGGVVVGSAVSAMSEINAASRKIADIITAIDEIAFQTNLLALNAAVEAARAGEQGRGFAVVAGEVRNLAQRSASAAKEIKGLIQDSVIKVEAGSKLVNQSGATLEEIVTSVKRVTDIVGEIAASSREQSTGIEQVNTAVTQMDAVTQANASQTEELAGTAEGLSGQAQQLMALVQKFRLGDDTANARRVVLEPTAQMKAALRPRSRTARQAAPVAAATGTDGFEEF